ncbi:AAA family ATPase [Crassaminicella profunda]|uniref:AAA family ATPase n=1 Tax=Crassaminicella profunda TaxID=1286698 RepID=UPI001CA77BD0|nr:ATP-binding protein [Crassaminicella profunda]QZY54970.1 ATP-binding protein [Crassaminicella profunda]
MIIQFNFRNHKSYKEETSLDMTATSIKEHPYNLIEINNKDQYLKVAAIYGANASGKSGLIEAFNFMRFFVLESFKRVGEGKGIPVKRFLFDKTSKKGTAEFEVFFILGDIEYQYGFVVDHTKVYQEWLYSKSSKKGNQYDTLFERNESQIHCGNKMKDAEKFKDLVEESTLFLSFISSAKIQQAKNVFKWFLDTQVIDFGNALLESFISRLLPVEKFKDETYRRNCEKFLKAIDTGIDGIRIEEIKNVRDEEGEISYKVYSRHKQLDSEEFMEIPFTEESSGTQKMFCLYDFLIETLEEGNTLFIDELDAKIHPLLLRYIINMFHNSSINKKNAQLIYTTHDIYTLTKETFRRDQIWFAEKDDNGVSNLFSLVEYRLDDDKKVRNDATYNKDYLLGRYGAVPLLKEFELMEGSNGK